MLFNNYQWCFFATCLSLIWYNLCKHYWIICTLFYAFDNEKWKNCNLNHFIIFTSPSARAGYDTRSIFKQSLTGLNSEFSYVKCNQSRPGFELVSPCPFPTTITITPQAPQFEPFYANCGKKYWVLGQWQKKWMTWKAQELLTNVQMF